MGTQQPNQLSPEELRAETQRRMAAQVAARQGRPVEQQDDDPDEE